MQLGEAKGKLCCGDGDGGSGSGLSVFVVNSEWQHTCSTFQAQCNSHTQKQTEYRSPPPPPLSLTLRNTSHTKHNCAAFISMFCPKCAVIREMEMNKHTSAHTDVHMHAYVCCTSVRRQFVSSTSGRTFYRCSCCCCCLHCWCFCLCLCSFCLLFLNRKLHFPVSFIVAFV